MFELDGPPDPWRSFFDNLDRLLGEPVTLHCLGGFVLVFAYGALRTTNDVDFIGVIPHSLRNILAELAGMGSSLHRRYKVYLDPVNVATVPDGYEDRLKALFPGVWKNLRLFVLEAHDLALAKLERNAERDRDDVLRLAHAGHLDPEVLRRRYLEELRPYLTREAWHDQTLELWMQSCWPEAYCGDDSSPPE